MPAIDSGGGHVPLDAVRLRLDISYDGTEFVGWATQAEQRTDINLQQQFVSLVKFKVQEQRTDPVRKQLVKQLL